LQGLATGVDEQMSDNVGMGIMGLIELRNLAPLMSAKL
jgi:hypothetical protein